MLEEQGGKLDDFVSTAKAVFQSLLDKHFPAPNHKKSLALLANTFKENSKDLADYSNRGARRARQETNKRIQSSMKSFTVSDDESTEDGSQTEDDDSFINDSSADENFKSADEDGENENDEQQIVHQNRKANQKKTNKELFKSESDADSDDYESLNSDDEKSSSISSDNESSDFSDDDDEEPWEKYASGKRSKSKKATKKKKKNLAFGSSEAGQYCDKMKLSLMDKFETFSDKLPKNTIDELIDRLGGPDFVAEMTGRKGRVVSSGDGGEVFYESRREETSLEMLNIAEKNKFMNGQKDIAIISEAG